MEPILLTCAAAMLVWGGVYLRWAGLWGCVLMTLLAGTVFGHAFFHVSIITSDRLLLAVCIVLVLIHRHLGTGQVTPWHWIDSAMMFFVGSMILSTFTHDWRAEEGWPLSKFLFFFLLPIGLYWVGRQIEITPHQLRWMFGSFACLGLYLAITAVAEKLGMSWAVFPRYINDPAHAEFLGRGRGPLLNPTGNGVLLTLGLCCTLMFYPHAQRIGRLAIGASIGIFLLGIYSTLTRCVWIGGAAALVGILWLTIPRRFRVSLAIVLLCGGIGVVALKSEQFKSFKRDKNVSVADMKQSAQLRPILAAFAWEMFQDRPITGCGTGQYLENVKYYLGERNIDLPLSKAREYVQHNVFLALLVENGLMGMIPFSVLWSWTLLSGWRLWQARHLALEYRQAGLVFLGYSSAYFINGMFHDLLVVPMMSMYLFFWIGVIRNLSVKHAAVASPHCLHDREHSIHLSSMPTARNV